MTTYQSIQQAQANMDSADRYIWVTFKREGIHCYPAAATDPRLNTGDEYNVAFLANPHRHVFHFRVSISVFHNDRDIEFIQFKRWLENLYRGAGPDNKNRVLELDNKSCEMIADDLYVQINSRYPNRHVIISVSEDDENGCEIAYRDPNSNKNVASSQIGE
jgi:hypothetical protein